MTAKILSAPALCVLGSATLLTLSPSPALAYMGPGLGLGAIGSVLGVLAALLLALASIVWYPLKRLLRRKRRGAPAKSAKISAAKISKASKP